MYREANCCADRLANLAHEVPRGCTILLNPPQEVNTLLWNDVIGVTHPRLCRG